MSRISRREDRLSAGLDSKELVDAVKSVREIDSTCRVYIKEWQFDFRGTEEDCKARFARKYDGRVYAGDWQVIPSDNGRDHVLQLKLWNVESEWKRRDLADAHVGDDAFANRYADKDYEIVDRNSRREHELRDYGIKKLPDPAPVT